MRSSFPNLLFINYIIAAKLRRFIFKKIPTIGYFFFGDAKDRIFKKIDKNSRGQIGDNIQSSNFQNITCLLV